MAEARITAHKCVWPLSPRAEAFRELLVKLLEPHFGYDGIGFDHLAQRFEEAAQRFDNADSE